MRWIKCCKIFLLIACFSFKGFTQEIITDTTLVPPPIQTVEEDNFDKATGQTEPVQFRTIPDTTVNRVRKDEDYWYANLPTSKKNNGKAKAENTESGKHGGSSGSAKNEKDDTETESVFERGWFNVLFWVIIVGGFAGALLWYLSSTNIRLFRKAPAAIDTQEEEAVSEDIFELDYNKQIDAAVRSQNYRLATRLMYLQTLKELADRELIQYKKEKTNSDYLFQLSGTKYYKDFFRLTRDFEYTWYGDFQLNQEAFTIVQKNFTTFKQQMP
jgi:hypothetical protein